MTHSEQASTPHLHPWRGHPGWVLVWSGLGLALAAGGIVHGHLGAMQILRSVGIGLVAAIPNMLYSKWAARSGLERDAANALRPCRRREPPPLDVPRVLAVIWMGVMLAVASAIHADKMVTSGALFACIVLLFPEQRALWLRIQGLRVLRSASDG